MNEVFFKDFPRSCGTVPLTYAIREEKFRFKGRRQAMSGEKTMFSDASPRLTHDGRPGNVCTVESSTSSEPRYREK